MTDVEIFASCLRELLLENDTVTVPGLGSFITRLMPASFSDRGRTINPPYKKLSFRSSEQGDAELFTSRLAKFLPEGRNAALWLADFTARFREELDRTKSVELASLGTMRATAQNDYFFVASDDLDIFPEAMGLEPVTIRSSQPMEEEAEPEESPEKEPIPEPETEPVPEPQPVAEPAPVVEAPAEKPRRKLKWWAILLIVLAALLLFLILSVIFKDILPWGDAVDNFINHLLYTEEELRIINTWTL